MEIDPDKPFNLAKQQTKEFLDKVIRNKKEAKIIVTMYDLRHPFHKPAEDFSKSVAKAQEEMMVLLQERQKFLDFMAEYL